MADSQSIVTLNIGSQTVSMGLFARSKDGGLILKKFETTTILADPSAEMTRLPQVRLAVSELAARVGASKEQVDYAISGQSVFTRFVKLPMLDGDDLEQLVAFEAQQHVPFPLDEVAWDWQLLEASGVEREVVIVAIKSDALDELNDCVRSSGLATGSVDSSPMALANAFKYNYGESEDTTLLIDVGAKTSNLIYLEGKRVFIRSIAIGGGSVTGAIAKEYGVTYNEAESQKLANGLVALDTRHTSEMDELTGALSACIRTSLNRMPSQIAQTTNFYRSQQGGGAPARVYIAGGGSNLKCIGDFFVEKLRLPVEFFNPLAKVAVGSDVNVEQVSTQAHQMGELVGLALRSIDKAPIAVDLVPTVVGVERDEKRRRPFLIGAAAVTLAAFGILYASTASKASKAKEMSEVVESRVKGLEKFSRPIESALKKEAKTKMLVEQYVAAHDGQRLWLEILSDATERFADSNVWITDFSPVVNYTPGSEVVKPAIKNDFAVHVYGASGLDTQKGDQPEFLSPGRPNPNYVTPVVNAIQIKGLWRGQGGASRVNDLVKALTTDSKFFTLEVEEESGRKTITRQLKDGEYIVENASGITQGNHAAPFKLIIPLKKTIQLK